MTTEPRSRVDAALAAFLADRLDATVRIDPAAGPLVEEIGRLVAAGGKRLRPTFCYWGFRAAGRDDDDRIVRAAAALELLHTMALVHDDLIDGAKERRGVPVTGVWFSERSAEFGARGDPEGFGRSLAVLVGDLSAVLADELLLASGFDAVALTHALAVYHPMRERMAVGQYLDVRGAGGDPVLARRAASLRGGSYTVEGPLLIGAALGDAPAGVVDVLRAYGGPLGEAFQLHDDLEDGDAPAGVSGATVRALAAEAVAALDRDVLGTEPTEALARLAGAMTR